MRFRDLITEGRDAPLFHGTALVNALSILHDNKITAGQQYPHNPQGVSLARDFKIAHEFGTYWDRQYSTVLVLDQQKLVGSRSKIVPYRDTDDQLKPRDRESEEIVYGDIYPLDRFLTSVTIPPDQLQKAAKDTKYHAWMIDEYGDYCEDDSWTFMKNKKTFRAAIESLMHHPKLNVWKPRPGIKLDLKEALVPDSEGLAAKGWYHPTTRKWIAIPQGWHHSNYVHDQSEMFDWDSIFSYSAEEYRRQYENFGRLIPAYDEFIIEGMKDAGWVRLGFIVATKIVYAEAAEFKSSQAGLRYYFKNVMPVDDVTQVIVDGKSPRDCVRGSPGEILSQRG